MRPQRTYLIDDGAGGKDQLAVLNGPCHQEVAGGKVRIAAVEPMALGGSAHVAEPAGDQKTAAEGIEPGAALESRQRTRLAHCRDPAQGNSSEPCGPNVEAAVGEKPEVDAAHDAKLQSPA